MAHRQELPGGTQYQAEGGDALNLDLRGTRKPMGHGNRRRPRRSQTEFNPDQPAPIRLVGDIRHRGRDGPVLGPGEAIEAKSRRLARTNPPHCRDREQGHGARFSGGHDGAEFLGSADNRSHRQLGGFAHLPGDRRPDDPQFDVVLELAECRCFQCGFPFQFRSLPLQLGQPNSPVAFLDDAFLFQAGRSESERPLCCVPRVPRGSAPLTAGRGTAEWPLARPPR